MADQSKAGVGWSHSPQSFKAGEEAAREALKPCGGLPPVFAIVYATILYDQAEVLKGVRSLLPASTPVVGCSTQGISRRGAVEEVDRVVGVTVLASRTITARAACARDISKAPRDAGRALAAALGDAAPGTFDFLWYDGVKGVNVDALLEGLAAEGHVRVMGGAAGHKWVASTGNTLQFFNGEVLSDAAVGLKVEGAEVVHDASHGTEPVGLELTATESDGNVVRQFNGRAALDVWKEQLGTDDVDNPDARMSWALAMSLPGDAGDSYDDTVVTRAVFGTDHDKKTLAFQATIPAGARVQVCHRTQKSVYDRALAMAKRVSGKLNGKRPVLALAFECGARPRPFLGDEKAQEELLAVQSHLGTEVPWLGLYAWGEIVPMEKKCYFGNFTFPLAVLCEKK